MNLDQVESYGRILNSAVEALTDDGRLFRPRPAPADDTFEKVERAKREWEATVDCLSELVCLVDADGRVMRANKTVEAWRLGRVQDVQGRELHDLLHPACAGPVCALRQTLNAALAQSFERMSAESDLDDPFLKRCLRISVHRVPERGLLPLQTVVVVVQDVTQRLQTEEALRRTALELQTRNEELSAYAHMVAHDLKNPLNNLLLRVEVMRDELADRPDAEQTAHVEALARVGQKMVSIVNELLWLAEVRQANVEVARLDMGHIVRGARQRLADEIARCGAEVSLPNDWPAALGYGPWVEEVWVNFLSNALKYGGQPPRLELGASAWNDGVVRFWARDYGRGVPPEEQGRLFMPFTRLSQGGQASGHGLGLSIVKRIVEKLNGTVGVESAGVPGQGSVFWFSLPAA